MTKLKIAIVDDNDIDRLNLKLEIEKQGKHEVVLLAAQGQDFYNQVLTKKIKPDVVLIDLKMPLMNGIQTFQNIKIYKLNIPAMMMSHGCSETAMQELLEVGCKYYFRKDPKLIHENLEKVWRQEEIQNIDLMHQEWKLESQKKNIYRLDEPYWKYLLNKIEQALIVCIHKGMSLKQMGSYFKRSISQIKKYRTSVLEKLKLKNTDEIIRWAQLNGLTELN